MCVSIIIGWLFGYKCCKVQCCIKVKLSQTNRYHFRHFGDNGCDNLSNKTLIHITDSFLLINLFISSMSISSMPNNEPHRTSLSLGLLSFNKKFYFFSGEGNYNFYVRFTMYLIIQTVMTLESVSVGCYTAFLYHQGSVAFLSFPTNSNTENIAVISIL